MCFHVFFYYLLPYRFQIIALFYQSQEEFIRNLAGVFDGDFITPIIKYNNILCESCVLWGWAALGYGFHLLSGHETPEPNATPPNAPDEILTFWFSDPRRPGVLRCPEWLFSNMAPNA